MADIQNQKNWLKSLQGPLGEVMTAVEKLGGNASATTSMIIFNELMRHAKEDYEGPRERFRKKDFPEWMKYQK